MTCRNAASARRMAPQVVVVAGASAGVGRAVVRRFAKDRCRIGLIARGRDRLEAAAREVREAGGEALVLPADVADAAALERAADDVEAEFGPIDTWVNAAMVTVFGPFLEIAPEDVRRVTDVTYLGSASGARAALRRMKPRDRGVLVQVGSALAHRGVPLQGPYCAAKHALQGLLDALRAELIHDGSAVRISTVHLPGVNTPQFDWARNLLQKRARPVPPVYQPEVAAEAVHLVAHRPRRELWLGGPSVQLILGQKFAPRLLDRMLARSAWSGQHAEAPARDRRDNLYDAPPGDPGARGRFDEEARGRSLQLRLLRRLGPLAPGALQDALFDPRGRR